MKTHNKAERAALYFAVAVIVALTGAAFWLSYAHLADVAGAYGLGSSPTRRWAWPGTLDLFIVAGEVLMFRAALRQQTDPWAVGLTIVGSLGSIALNVSGVGSHAAVLDYVVAAVPPTAALLAFGALMRQVHVMVTAPATADAVATEEPANVATPATEEPDMAMATDWDMALSSLSAAPATPVTMPATVSAPTSVVTAQVDTEADIHPALKAGPVDTGRPVPSRGRSLEEILSAVRFLEDSGQSVTGSTYAAHVGGISTRTGRRDLQRVGIESA